MLYNLHFVVNYILLWITFPGHAFYFAKSAGGVHPLCRDERRMIVRGYSRGFNPAISEPSENVVDLLLSKSSPSKLWQDAIVSDDSVCLSRSWIEREQTDKIRIRPTQERACTNGRWILEHVAICLFPVRDLGSPSLRLRFDQLRIALVEKRGNDARPSFKW